LELFIIILLVLLNGFFALSEIALVSSRKTKLEERARKGDRGAIAALELLENPERFLSTVQIGITLVGVISGTFGGVALADNIKPFIEQIEILRPKAYEISLGIIVTFITYLSLVIGELVPKSLGLTNPEGISIFLARFLNAFATATHPIASFLSFSTRLVLKLLRIREKQEAPVSEEEMKLIIEQGVEHGVIEEQENEMIKSIFRFADRKAYSIMTNRRFVNWLDIKLPFDEIRARVLASEHTKLPVCEGDLDRVTGILNTKTFVNRLSTASGPFDIQELLIRPVFIPETTRAIKILELFRENKLYVGIIVDEYGSTAGMLTLHDLIENIFGYLPEQNRTEEQSVIRREDGSFLIDGDTQIEELKDLIDLPEFSEDEQEYTTLAGFAIWHLKKVPRTGEYFTSGGYRFEIVDMDLNRIDKILVSRPMPPAAAEEG
jgi:putative hemolysin